MNLEILTLQLKGETAERWTANEGEGPLRDDRRRRCLA